MRSRMALAELSERLLDGGVGLQLSYDQEVVLVVHRLAVGGEGD